MEALTTEVQRDHFLSTDQVFRTVYKIVKSARPFTDLPTDTDLQVLNGLDILKNFTLRPFLCSNQSVYSE